VVRPMTLPNFLVIGAAKSGTDSLYGMLDQHPEVHMSPNKEPMFFVAEGQPQVPYKGPGDREALIRWDSWVSTRERYESLFAGAKDEKAIGEASTWYLYDEHAPLRIRRHIPDAKLIAILRNPAERAYSAFTMLHRDGRETTMDFIQALAAEERRVAAGWEPMWHYRRMGFYFKQLVRYLGIFRRERILVLLQDDLNSRPVETLRDVFAFLGVDQTFEPDASERRNVSLVPDHSTYHRFVEGPSPLKAAGRALLPLAARQRIKRMLPTSTMRKPEPIPPQARAMLVDEFRDDVLALQGLLDRDLESWLR
jgi:hypothetical protein